MYPVSPEYREKIQENDRTFVVRIEIEHSKGVLSLSDKDIVNNSLIYTESTQAGEEFTIGGTVASDLVIDIMNRPEYDSIEFMGATVKPYVGLLISSVDDYTYFMQASQPVSFIDEDIYEEIPLGIFNIDDVNRQRNTIKLKAIDNMINLDKPYSLSKLSYPATLMQIYVNICNVCDVMVGTGSFPNMDYVVQEKPQDDLTFRDMIGYVAELSGTFAKCNRHGALELRWYESTDIELGPMNRFNFIPRDDLVQIKGVMATVGDTTYLAGSEDYAIDLSDNPLLQGGYQTVLPNIYNNVKNTVFTPYESSWQGNPAIQAGDMITQIDRDGKAYNTLITSSTYKFRGASTLSAKGLPEISKGYKGSTNRKIANIIRKVEKQVGDRLTTLEQMQLNATELIANMLGGYAIQREDGFYVADNKDLSMAQRVWKWGLGGFGYSSTGVNGPYETAITADGSIVAMLVAANIITADMVQTGILQSEDGSTWINLDNGTANFRDQLVIDSQGVNLTIGNKQTGNYISLAPNSPFEAYLNNEIQVEMWTDSRMGGYILANRPDGKTAFRVQGLGNSVNGFQMHTGDLGSGSKAEFWSNNFEFIGTGSYPLFYATTDGYFNGDLGCKGEKTAIVNTEHYGKRALYSEESDRLYFNTKGIAETINNKYIIRLDDAFLETIEPNSVCKYIIDITEYSNAKAWPKLVLDKYIVIESDIDCEFSYTISCTRKGYKDTYLEERDLKADRTRNREG